MGKPTKPGGKQDKDRTKLMDHLKPVHHESVPGIMGSFKGKNGIVKVFRETGHGVYKFGFHVVKPSGGSEELVRARWVYTLEQLRQVMKKEEGIDLPLNFK
ncbi:MAG TPA: hypothetical protein VFF13_02700 [archaeon]|nr:hypothetical protein [archaeon]